MLGPGGSKALKEASKVAALGIEMGLAVVIGLFAGRWLDTQLGTAPLLLFLGLAFGLATGFRRLYTVARQYQRTAKTETEPYEPPPDADPDYLYPDPEPSSDSAPPPETDEDPETH